MAILALTFRNNIVRKTSLGACLSVKFGKQEHLLHGTAVRIKPVISYKLLRMVPAMWQALRK